MKPIIGLISKIDNERTSSVKDQYGAAISRVGGVPILLPYVTDEEVIAQFVALCDGIVFTGGADIEPARYCEEKSEACGVTQPYRDELEFKVFAQVLPTNKPVLAICRGMQLVNVAFGGTLYQDISSQLPEAILHKQSEPKDTCAHEIEVLENTPLYDLLGKGGMQVNTFHHQAVKRLGEGLAVMARAKDGVAEAVYLPGERYFRAYQWHPECLVEACPDNEKILQDFVNACKKA